MGRKIRNPTIVVEHTGKHIPIVELDGDITAQELSDVLANKINIPGGTNTVLIRKLTHRQLVPHQSLGDVGIKDKETLIVDSERLAGGSLEFYPNGRVQRIQTEPEETPYLAEILHEISGLHKIVESLEERLGTVTAEIKDIRDSIVIVSGQDGTAKTHMEPNTNGHEDFTNSDNKDCLT